MRKTVYALIFCGSSLALSACVTDFLPTPPAIDFAAFTTEGKPTKPVVTEWGRSDVYDPAQDPEVKAAFDYVFDRGLAYEKSPESDPTIEADLKPYVEFFEKIEKIQMNDLARSGCKSTTVAYCRGDDIIQNKLSECPKLNWGRPEMNVCEAGNIEFSANDPAEVVLGNIGAECFASNMDFTGIYQNTEHFTRKQSFKSNFRRLCGYDPNAQTE